MNHATELGTSRRSPAQAERVCSDFEDTVRYPAGAMALTSRIGEVDASDTLVEGPPSGVMVHFGAPSESLIADAEAIIGAFRRQRAPASWEPLLQQEPAALVVLPGLPARRWPQRLADATRTAGRSLREIAATCRRWILASPLVRWSRRGQCPDCNAPRTFCDLSLALPGVSPWEIASAAERGELAFIERLPQTTCTNQRLIVNVSRCSPCATHARIELIWVQGPWREIIASGIQIGDATARSLIARRGESNAGCTSLAQDCA